MRNSRPDSLQWQAWAEDTLAALADGLTCLQAGRRTPLRVCVGFSGGLDSVVLLDLFARLRSSLPFELSALHVHHGISPHAAQWAAHCRSVCKGRGVPFRLRRVTVNRSPRTSLEEEARRVRYAAFGGVAADIVVVAHHADDQAETVLTQLMRGAGPKGAAGMPEFRALVTDSGAQKILWRPLLQSSRAELASYAEGASLKWIDDESNTDTRFKRNFVRAEVLPLLCQGFPAPVKALSRAARHFAEASQLAEALADIDVAAAACDTGLRVEALKGFEHARLKNLLRRWIELRGERAPSERRLLALAKAIRQSSNDTRMEWVHEGLVVRRKKGVLICV